MTTLLRITLPLLALITAFSNAALAQSSEESLTFAENTMPLPTAENAAKDRGNGIGIFSSTTGGYGFFYERFESERWVLRFDGMYDGTKTKSVFKFKPSETVGYADFNLRDRIWLTAGIDRLIYLTDNHTWALIAGLGVGYFSTEAQEKYYPTMCTWFCGYNPNIIMAESTRTDRAAILSGRFGVRVREVRVFGQKSDFSVTVIPVLHHWPTLLSFNMPDGRTIKLDSIEYNRLVFEGSLMF